MNKVVEVLADLVQNADRENMTYRGKVYRFSDADLPAKAGVALVRSRLAAIGGEEDAPDEE